ncbi:hemerythrin domain-containing protein [Streptomyces roseolus]|uniref:hemerythrin domain-containing protein n=1 Tax=Streptomyces roseolus TaxID=67358 RepID=UPI003640EDCB
MRGWPPPPSRPTASRRRGTSSSTPPSGSARSSPHSAPASASTSPAGAGAPRELRAHCLAFCSAPTRHHTAEDGGVFPALAEAHPELRPVLDELAHDHRQVGELLSRFQTLLDGLIALAESHFTFEEKKLVAALDGLSAPLPDDFALRDLTDI